MKAALRRPSCRGARNEFRAPKAGLRALAAGLLAAALFCGCVSPRNHPVAKLQMLAGEQTRLAEQQARQTLAHLFPPEYRASQRAIITVGRKQFACDGILKVSTQEGWHLALVSNLGLVTELRMRKDGGSEVLRVTPLFREAWSRQYVARDLQRLLAPPGPLEFAGWLPDGSFALESRPATDGLTARYLFSPGKGRLQALELIRAGHCVYHAAFRHYRAFAGCANEVPSECDVNAGAYQLDLRIAELAVGAGSASATAGGKP
jgi:hypothetical protein